MVVFAQAFPKYEVDRVCNQVDEDLKYLDRKQSSNVSILSFEFKNQTSKNMANDIPRKRERTPPRELQRDPPFSKLGS